MAAGQVSNIFVWGRRNFTLNQLLILGCRWGLINECHQAPVILESLALKQEMFLLEQLICEKVLPAKKFLRR